MRKATARGVWAALLLSAIMLPSVQASAQSTFGGRLTPQINSPIVKFDHVGAQNIYYAPDGGKTVPVLSGGTWIDRQFTASPTDETGLTLALSGSSNWPAGSIHDVFAVYDSGAVKLATRQWDAAMYAADVQITNVTAITTGTGATAWLRASAAFDGNLAQGWNSGARVYPSNPDNASGFPANCIGQDWGSGNEQVVSKFVLTAANDNNLQGMGSSALKIVALASNDNVNWTRLGFYYIDVSMVAGSYPIPINEGNLLPYRYAAVCVTGEANQSPGYSVNIAELQFFKRVEGVRRLACYDGLQVNDAALVGARIGASATINVAQYEASYLGSFAVDDSAPGQVTVHVSFGPNRVFNLWNEYHREQITLQAGVVTPGVSSYALTSQRWQIVQAGFSLKVLQGRAVDRPHTHLSRLFFINAGAGYKAYEAGIAIDNTFAFSCSQIAANFDNTGPQAGSVQHTECDLLPFAGIKEIIAIERTNNGPGSVSPGVDFRSTALTARWRG